VQVISRIPEKAVEVVLIDNGSVDNTCEVIKLWKAQVSFPVHYVFEGRTGLAIARNTGIRASSGNVMVFTDDDCVLRSDYLQVLNRYCEQDTDLIMRGGRVELGDPTDQPFTIKLGNNTIRMSAMDRPDGFIIGANMAMKRALMDKIGLFDERFGAGAVFKAAEETDYIYRVFRAGFPVEYVPDLIVQHFHGRKDLNSIHRMNYGYQMGGGAVYAKYIFDKKLLRHFYWDIKRYVYLFLFDRKLLDNPLGISYGMGLLATAKGILLYGLENLRHHLRIPRYHL